MIRIEPHTRVLPTTGPTLVVTSSYPRFAGDYAGDFVYRLHRSLRQTHGIPFRVLTSEDARTGDVTLQEDVRRFRYFPRRLQSLAYGDGMPSNLARSPLRWLQVPGYLRSMVRGIATELSSVERLHAHWLVPAGLACALAGSRAHSAVPLVISVHSSDLSLLERMPGGAALARWILQRAKTITCVSEEQAKRLRMLVGDSLPRLQTIPMGCDERLFDLDPPAPIATRRKGLFLGRMVPVKGLDILADALQRCPKIEWTFAGDGPELAPLCRQLDGRHSIHWHGAYRTDELPGLLAGHDFVAIPSRGRPGSGGEGMPVVLMEALAGARPVVATDVGGIGEVVRHGVNGLLVPPEDPAALAQAIGELVAGPDWGAICAAARRSARGFAQTSIAERFARLYGCVEGERMAC